MTPFPPPPPPRRSRVGLIAGVMIAGSVLGLGGAFIHHDLTDPATADPPAASCLRVCAEPAPVRDVSDDTAAAVLAIDLAWDSASRADRASICEAYGLLGFDWVVEQFWSSGTSSANAAERAAVEHELHRILDGTC